MKSINDLSGYVVHKKKSVIYASIHNYIMWLFDKIIRLHNISESTSYHE
jgi:hypothetical protein